MRSTLTDQVGAALDATFEVELAGGIPQVVFFHRYGTSGRREAVNTDYIRGLETLLSRLASLPTLATSIDLDSGVARRLPLAERRLPLDFPILISEMTDCAALRLAITNAQRRVGRRPGSKSGGGNTQKTIRLALEFPGLQLGADELTELLAGPAAGREGGALSSNGTPYRWSSATTSGQSTVFELDHALRERGLRGHVETQNALARSLLDNGIEPRSPGAGEPNFDIAWKHADALHVCEVKSLTRLNEEDQLRLGLGQLLRYRQTIRRSGLGARGVLAVERAPTDPSWVDLCQELDVLLTWPADWPGLLLGAQPTH